MTWFVITLLWVAVVLLLVCEDWWVVCRVAHRMDGSHLEPRDWLHPGQPWLCATGCRSDPSCRARHCDRRRSGRLLDGREWSEMPWHVGL